jgi:hypothetical protein
MKSRQQFSTKLTNMPPNTTAFDLQHVIRATGAKTCYIPRAMSYKRKRFAVIAFEDEAKLLNAIELEFSLGELALKWNPIDTKLCAICNNSEHLAAQCPIKERRTQWNTYNQEQASRFDRLYNKFKPAKTTQIRNMYQQRTTSRKTTPASYATAARGDPQGTHQEIQQTMNKEDLKTIINMLQEVKQEISELKQQVQLLDERVTWIESTYEEEVQNEMEQVEQPPP